MRRNQIAKLSQNSELARGWFGVSFFHLCRVTELKSHANHFFLWFNQDSYGMAVILDGSKIINAATAASVITVNYHRRFAFNFHFVLRGPASAAKSGRHYLANLV